MRRQDINKSIPNTPGVYLFVTDNKQLATNNKEILYIGKATSLYDRVSSYFSSDLEQSRGPLIVKMLEEAMSVEVRETDSVLDALILEATLIKKYQPPYNSKEKSDKSFNYVVITKEEYPRVFTVRGRDLTEKYYSNEFKYTFGPFPYGGQLREALKIVRKIFPFRGEKDSVQNKKKKSTIRREIGLVPNFEIVGKQEYARTIQHLRLFFEGKKKKLITELEKEMKHLAKEKKFEKAEEIKRKIFALQHIRDVSLIKHTKYNLLPTITPRIEAYDVAHTAGIDTVGVMIVLEDGRPKKADYRKFKVKSKKSKGDTGALREILERRLSHDEWQLPRLIVVDGAKAQQNTAEKVLSEFGYKIPVVAVVKDAGHKPKKILGKSKYTALYEREIIIANSEAHRFALAFHKSHRWKV